MVKFRRDGDVATMQRAGSGNRLEQRLVLGVPPAEPAHFRLTGPRQHHTTTNVSATNQSANQSEREQ